VASVSGGFIERLSICRGCGQWGDFKWRSVLSLSEEALLRTGCYVGLRGESSRLLTSCIVICIIICMAPTVLRTRNLSVRIYPKDHNPPHVHVVGPGAEAKFRLDTFECIFCRGFIQKAVKRIKVFLKERKSLLMEAWNDYQE